MNIFWTWVLISVSSSILSHSSRTKWERFSRLSFLLWQRARILPGVPMMIWGVVFSFLRIFWFSWIGTPPKKTSFLSLGKNFENLSNSFLIWYANSLVLQRIKADAGLGSSSSWFKMERINTAVFPKPETAWQSTSLPLFAWGMHSCWTSEGCSKPQSWMALLISFLRRKSLKFVVWTLLMFVVTFFDFYPPVWAPKLFSYKLSCRNCGSSGGKKFSMSSISSFGSMFLLIWIFNYIQPKIDY